MQPNHTNLPYLIFLFVKIYRSNYDCQLLTASDNLSIYHLIYNKIFK
nr:MAG TPA: hypothetical protein [Caudoviricetes sp.]